MILKNIILYLNRLVTRKMGEIHMDMENKKIKKFLIIIFIIICSFLVFKLKSEDIKLSNNTKKLEENLKSNLNKDSSVCKGLFDFDYDKVYVFQPYLPKSEMEKEIGFKYNKLRETVSEGMMNILFVKDNAPIVYLYGYPGDLGYYINLPIGEYSKSDLDKVKYKIKEIKLDNSPGEKQIYKEYTINT